MHTNKFKIKYARFTEEMFRELINHSTNIMVINGLDGYFRLVNPAFEKLLGYTAEEIMARHFFLFLHPEDLPATQAAMKRRIQGEHTYHFENRYQRKDGSYVWIEWTSFPVIAHNEMYAVGHNITDRRAIEAEKLKLEQEKLAREKAEKELELKNYFLLKATANLVTPLHSLLVSLQLLTQNLENGILAKLPKDEAMICVNEVRNQIKHFSELSGELLDVAHNLGQEK